VNLINLIIINNASNGLKYKKCYAAMGQKKNMNKGIQAKNKQTKMHKE